MKFLRILSTVAFPTISFLPPHTCECIDKVNGQAGRFCCYEDSGLERSQCISSPNFCCLCLFHFPHRLVLCCFMYVSLVVSSMWFLCLSASYLFVSSLALLLFSLPRLPAISPPHSHPHSISFSFSAPPLTPPSPSLALTLIPYLSLLPPPLPFLSIFLILAALPAADD